MTQRALISADNHVFEPVTLWQERLPVGFRERGPRLEQSGDWHVMAIEGMPDRKLARADGAAAKNGEAKQSHRDRHGRRRRRSRRAARRTWRSTAWSPR